MKYCSAIDILPGNFVNEIRASHEGQKRDDGSDYFDNHLMPVANMYLGYAPQTPENDTVLAIYTGVALAHDVLEDTDTSESELLAIFKNNFALVHHSLFDEAIYSVHALTKPQASLTLQEKVRYWENIATQNFNCVAIKMCDRLHNIQSALGVWNANRFRKQVRETHIMDGVFAGTKETLENHGFYNLVERWDKTLQSL